jgi:antitoxin component of MazEF toxin-antitoxin module
MRRAARRLTIEDGALIVRFAPAKKRRRYSLEELVEQITEENIHHEIEWSSPAR